MLRTNRLKNRKISAHYIFPVVSSPIRNGIIELDETNSLIEIRTPHTMVEEERLEFYSGVIIPNIQGISILTLIDKQLQYPTADFTSLLKLFADDESVGWFPGKKCSIFLIDPFDLVNFKLTSQSRLKKLV